jgi:hypothetical protein
MPSISPHFRFEYFRRGGYYSAQSEFQRFATVDYNMQSYVGVIGVGVIDGWEIEHTNDTGIKILPGRGIINGFFAESPYVVKRRSEMVSGDREVEIVKVQQAPEPDMTDAEADVYIAVVQEYDATFDPDKPIEDAYVKVVIPEKITLGDELDTYIWVTRTHTQFFPPLSDYPPYLIPEPSINDYDTWDEYVVVRTAYDAQMDAIYSYQFRDDPSNHFTEATFNVGLKINPGGIPLICSAMIMTCNNLIGVICDG